jgi:hypothetical protein
MNRTTVGSASTLDEALNGIAQNYFGKPLGDSPINPNSIIMENGSVCIDFKSDIYNANLGSLSEASLLFDY